MFEPRLPRSALVLALATVFMLLASLVSAVQLAGAAPQGKDNPKKGAKADMPLDIKGELAANDPVDPVHNEPCKTYKVKLKKGKIYIIDMTSTEFDSYLRLEDAKGKQLAEDDDSGGAQNAQITFQPEDDGEFKIIATRFDATMGVGNFTLTVRPLSYKTAKALPLKDGQLTVEGKLTEDDPKDNAGPRHVYKLHTVHMVAGRTYTIDMSSPTFDTYLRLMDSQFRKLAEDDDSGGGNNNTDSRIVFMPKTDGDYHIVATTFDGNTGDYTLKVREEK